MKFAATTFALVLATALGVSTSFAADKAAATSTAKTLTPQQQKMKDCNKQAGDKKGDERKAFLSTCLKSDNSAGAPAAAATSATAAPATPSAPVAGPPKSGLQQAQREKMTTCNAEAGKQHLAGAERKSFMSKCLKGDSAAAAAKH